MVIEKENLVFLFFFFYLCNQVVESQIQKQPSVTTFFIQSIFTCSSWTCYNHSTTDHQFLSSTFQKCWKILLKLVVIGFLDFLWACIKYENIPFIAFNPFRNLTPPWICFLSFNNLAFTKLLFGIIPLHFFFNL